MHEYSDEVSAEPASDKAENKRAHRQRRRRTSRGELGDTEYATTSNPAHRARNSPEQAQQADRRLGFINKSVAAMTAAKVAFKSKFPKAGPSSPHPVSLPAPIERPLPPLPVSEAQPNQQTTGAEPRPSSAKNRSKFGSRVSSTTAVPAQPPQQPPQMFAGEETTWDCSLKPSEAANKPDIKLESHNGKDGPAFLKVADAAIPDASNAEVPAPQHHSASLPLHTQQGSFFIDFDEVTLDKDTAGDATLSQADAELKLAQIWGCIRDASRKPYLQDLDTDSPIEAIKRTFKECETLNDSIKDSRTKVRKLEEEILEAKNELRASNTTVIDLEKEVEKLKREGAGEDANTGEKTAELDDTIRELRKEIGKHNKKAAHLEGTNARLQYDKEKLVQDHEQENRTLKGVITRLYKEKDDLVKDYGREKTLLAEKVAKVTQEKTDLAMAHTIQLDNERQIHQGHIDQQKEQHDEKLRKARETAGVELGEAERNHITKTNALKIDHTKERTQLLMQLRKTKHEYEQRESEMLIKHQEALARLRNELEEWSQAIELVKDQARLKLESQKKTLDDEFEMRATELQGEIEKQLVLLEQERARRVNDLREQKIRLSTEWEEIRKDLNKRIQNLTQSIEKEKHQKLRELHEQKARLELDREEHTKALQEQIQSLNQFVQEEKDRMLNDLKEQKLMLEAEWSSQFKALEEQVGTLHQSLEIEKARRLRELQELEKKKDEEAAARMEDLRLNYEEVKAALVARDNIKGLTDMDLNTRFKALSTRIEEFSRMKWDVNKVATWPLSDHALRQLNPDGATGRILKLQILQNCVWLILYKKIFCMPFSVLGEEGENLNREWVEGYGNSQVSQEVRFWPEPSEDSEKFRYDAAKSLLKALRASAELSNDMEQQQDTYDKALDSVNEQIIRSFLRVCSLGAKDREKLNGLVRMAAMLWLEICSQRYRIVVALPGDSVDILTTPKQSRRRLVLIVRPELRRFGNAQGQNLAKMEIVGGLKSDIKMYEA